MQIRSKHALVTGSGKRLGRAIAEALLQEGAKLTAHYRSSADAVQQLKTWAEQHKLGPVYPSQADLSQPAQIQQLLRSAESQFGPVDILINCASDFYPTPVLSVTEEQWEALMDVNLKGPFFTAQAAATGMLIKGGVIINLADVNGERVMKNYTPYVVSKAGLLMLTKNLAKEWAPKIRLNSVSPGPVLLPENYTPEQVQRSTDRTLLKRLGTPDDIVQAVLFLIKNDYVTGLDLKVDGGRSLC